jgi:methanogenic corrinoid protein MtbC1
MAISIEFISDFERALLFLQKQEAENIFVRASEKYGPWEVASELVVKTLERIGDGWEKGTVALSQVFLSSMICEELVDKILPPGSPVRIDQPSVGIAVFEDYHVLGKRMVYSALRASGYELIDLGNGLKSNEILELVEQHQIRILMLSVLMLPSALRIKELAPELKKRGVRLIVGGAPFRFDEELWKEIGADGTGRNPAEALEALLRILEEIK